MKQIIKSAEKNKVAIGHFNISDLTALKAIFEAAKGLKVPVIIGTSRGEADFLDRNEAAALVKTLREENDFPIFLNADHAHSLKEVKEAVEAGYDAVLFDAGKLSLDENIKQTKIAVELIRAMNPNVLIEGELGFIGGSSKMLEKLPEDISEMTSPEDAARFVKETGIDLLAPAVGNIHGILMRTNADLMRRPKGRASSSAGTNAEKGSQRSRLKSAESANPPLDIKRIKDIRKVAGVPLVLHGGSGISDSDFKKAIAAGISIIHINTELRVAWRKGIEEGLKENPGEIAPYKVLPEAVEKIKEVVKRRLQLFNKP